MTPIDVSPEGVAFTTLPRVPEAARALVAATGAAEVTFRTRRPLGEILDSVAESPAGTRVIVGTWSVAAELFFRYLIRAAIPGGDGSEDGGAVGVAFTYVGTMTVLVLVGASDTWRVGLTAEVALSSRPGDLLVAIEPAPPGAPLVEPPPARSRLRLVRGGR